MNKNILGGADEEQQQQPPPKIPYEQVFQKRERNESNTDIDVPGVRPGTNGGLTFIDEETIAKQYKVIQSLLQQMGRNLLERKSLVDVSLPVNLFEPRTFLERITDVWAYPFYLSKAARVTNDPLERLKLVICFLISGLHRGSKQVKPFNPILGETFQASLLDGSQIYCEQISHHPPITQFEVVGADNMWVFEGRHEYKAHFTASGIEGGQYGPNTIRFHDGGCVTFNMPPVRLTGIIMGERNFTYFDTVVFEDQQNGLRAEVKLNPDAVTGLASWISTPVTPTDTIRGHIVHHGHKCTTISGSWIRELVFDRNVYWRIGEYKCYAPVSWGADRTLESDARKRTDVLALLAGDLEKAQAEKSRLENLQRRDAKMRKEQKKERERQRKLAAKRSSKSPTSGTDSEAAELSSTGSGWGFW